METAIIQKMYTTYMTSKFHSTEVDKSLYDKATHFLFANFDETNGLKGF